MPTENFISDIIMTNFEYDKHCDLAINFDFILPYSTFWNQSLGAGNSSSWSIELIIVKLINFTDLSHRFCC